MVELLAQGGVLQDDEITVLEVCPRLAISTSCSGQLPVERLLAHMAISPSTLLSSPFIQISAKSQVGYSI